VVLPEAKLNRLLLIGRKRRHQIEELAGSLPALDQRGWDVLVAAFDALFGNGIVAQVDDVPAPPAAVDGEVGGDAKEPCGERSAARLVARERA